MVSMIHYLLALAYRFALTISTSLVISSRLGGFFFALACIFFITFKKLSLFLNSRIEIRFRSARSLSILPALGFNMSICNDAISEYKKISELRRGLQRQYSEGHGFAKYISPCLHFFQNPVGSFFIKF